MSKHRNTKVRGYGGIGMSKHRTSGKSPKSPKLKYWMRLEAEKNERKFVQKCFSTVTELFGIQRKKSI